VKRKRHAFSICRLGVCLSVSPAVFAEPPAVHLLKADGAGVSVQDVAYGETSLVVWKTADAPSETLQAGQVREIHFPGPSDVEEPLHRFSPDQWNFHHKGAVVIDREGLVLKGRNGLSHPWPDNLPGRFQLDLRLEADPPLHAFQWRVFEGEGGDFSKNGFSLAVFQQELRLQGAGVRTVFQRTPRERLALPKVRHLRLQLFHDLKTGECRLHVNRRPVLQWTMHGDKDLVATGIRFRWSESGGSPVRIREYAIRAWPERSPETEAWDETAATDQILLRNGDLLPIDLRRITGTHVEGRLVSGRDLRIDRGRVLKIRFKP
jgi:hypothetical protein